MNTIIVITFRESPEAIGSDETVAHVASNWKKAEAWIEAASTKDDPFLTEEGQHWWASEEIVDYEDDWVFSTVEDRSYDRWGGLLHSEKRK